MLTSRLARTRQLLRFQLYTRNISATPIAALNVHEYVGSELFKKYDVSVPKGGMVNSPEAAVELFDSVGTDMVMKAQVLAGGRGKGSFTNGFKSGVHMITDRNQAKEIASKMIGQTLVTKQTGEEGKPCSKLYMAERVYSRRELYFAVLLDRAHGGPVMVASTEGGTSIEEVAAATPDKILTSPIDIMQGPTDQQLSELADGLSFNTPELKEQAIHTMRQTYQLFIENDATLVEINPLVETPDAKLFVCDAKLNFDDNAEFRQKEIFEHRDTSQEDKREVDAAQYDLNYIGLDGSIGCMVNGAGLAMATMDIIKLHGGDPANFLDVGGGASQSQVKKAFEILNADQRVKAILVNIFGGIMRCDVIAGGIIAAAAELSLSKPVILRLQGTNVDVAKQLIEGSGFRMIMADDLDDAAQKSCRIAEIVRQAEEISVGVSFELPI
eukprot:g2497.t1